MSSLIFSEKYNKKKFKISAAEVNPESGNLQTMQTHNVRIQGVFTRYFMFIFASNYILLVLNIIVFMLGKYFQ